MIHEILNDLTLSLLSYPIFVQTCPAQDSHSGLFCSSWKRPNSFLSHDPDTPLTICLKGSGPKYLHGMIPDFSRTLFSLTGNVFHDHSRLLPHAFLHHSPPTLLYFYHSSYHNQNIIIYLLIFFTVCLPPLDVRSMKVRDFTPKPRTLLDIL